MRIFSARAKLTFLALRLHTICMVALLWVFSVDSSAGVNQWTSIGPEGGTATVLVIDPASPTTLYAGTYGGVYKSTNSGNNWSKASNGLTTVSILTLSIDPTTPSTLYTGTNGGGIFKSTNRGSNWSASGLSAMTINSIAIDPITSSTLYAGTQGGGVYKSTNGGSNWSAVNAGLTSLYVYSLAVDPNTPSTLYAGTYIGVFKSSNGGQTWDAINSGWQTAIYSLSVDPKTPTTLYAGTYQRGIIKSTNGGSSWTDVNNGLTVAYSTSFYSIVIDPKTPTTLYAGTYGGGIFKSTNAGSSWSAANIGVTSTFIHALAVDPATPTVLYAGTKNIGVFKSTNSARDWSISSSGLITTTIRAFAVDPTPPATLYAGTYGGGVFKSSNGGSNWSTVNSGLSEMTIYSLAIDPMTTSNLYAGTAGSGVFKSTNGGSTWSAVNTGLSAMTIYTLTVDSATPSTLYAGTSGGGVFKSTNGGSNWSAVNSGLSAMTINAIAIDPMTSSTLYAGTQGGGLFKSTNSGSSWALINNGLTSQYIYSIAIDPTSPTTLYAATHIGVYKSTDAGTTWHNVNNGLTTTSAISLSIDTTTPSILYAGTLGGGVFRTTNGGNNWSSMNNGLTTMSIASIAIDPISPSSFYAGTYGGGAFSYAQSALPACGDSNGMTLSAAPTDLCLSGTASAISGSGPWTWNCTGAGGETAQCIANINTVSYVQSDLAGRWESNSIASGPGAPWWGRGSFTVTANGSATGTFVESDGNTEMIAKTFSLAADGTVTVAGSNPDMSCKLDSSKMFITCTDTWSSWMSGTVELFVMTKMADTSYAIADLAGTWSFNHYETPGLHWTRGMVTVSSSGTYSMTSEANDGGQTTETGTLEISSSGIVTRSGVPISASRCALDALKTILVCTSTGGSASSGMQILTKNGTNYNQSDLVGVWNYSNIASPDQWYGRGTANFTSDGNLSVSFYGSDGITYSHAGPYSISPSGSITGASPPGSCSMDSLKRIITCVTFNSKKTNADLMIYTAAKPAPVPSAPVNGACGSSNRQTFVSVPTGNLCLDGTTSAVAGSGPWSWSCQGANGGEDAFCIANKQTMTFSSAGMAGTWESNGIEAPGPWWSRGTFTVIADGSFSSSNVTASDGPRPPLSGSFVVSADGIMTAPAFGPEFRCVIDPATSVNTCTNSNNNGKELVISVRKAASYALADLQGTWESHALGTPGPYWSHGSFTIAADGTATAMVTQDNGSTTSFSGTFSMPSSGIFTLSSPQLQPNEQATMRCVMDSLKSVMVCTSSHDSSGSLETTMTIYVKKAPDYSQADLTGAWQVNNLVSPTNAWWGRGMFAFASDGSFTAHMNGSDGPGDIMSFTGTSSFTSNGNFAFDGVPTMHCSMDAAKRLVVCTNTSTTGSGDATILVMTAATAPRAGQCGSSNGGSFTSAPSVGLCADGSAPPIAGSGPWSWSCQGSRGGTTATCSAGITRWNLDVTITGRGSVTSDPAGIACVLSGPGGSCSASFDHGSAVTLLPLGSNSTFASWSGDLTGSANPGSITMDSSKTVTATFTADPAKVKIDGDPSPYYTIGSALDASIQNSTIRIQAAPMFTESITMANPAAILIKGGYTDSGFTNQTGFTRLSGVLIIKSGSLIIDRLEIAP